MAEQHVCERHDDFSALRERLAIVEQSNKAGHHRIDSLSEQTQALIKVANSIEFMSHKVEEMLYVMKEHDGRLDNLEKAPGDKANGYIETAVKTLITIVVGAMLGYLVKP